MDMVTIVSILLTGVIGLGGWYFKRNEDRLDKNDERLQHYIEGVNQGFNDYKVEAQKTFVTKDEFIRAISNQDKKLDSIGEKIDRLYENLTRPQ